MFHVISARLNRLARKIGALRDGQVSEYAAWHGWTVVEVSSGTWRYRDPRFDQLAAHRTEATPAARTWAQAALADGIHGLDLTADDTGNARRWS